MEDATSILSRIPTPPPPGLVGFTGTRRNLRAAEEFIIRDVLDHLGDWHGFVTGACVGIDTFIGRHLVETFPEHRHIVYVPANRSRVCRWWPPFGGLVEVREMPPDTSYEDRNRAIVGSSTYLIGIPEYTEHEPRSRRSGTWQTIRMARRIHQMDPAVITLASL